MSSQELVANETNKAHLQFLLPQYDLRNLNSKNRLRKEEERAHMQLLLPRYDFCD